jgi:hypothetical protein
LLFVPRCSAARRPTLAQQPALMSADRAKAACDPWNREATPFESFLLLVGKVGSSAASCPAP